MSGPCSSPEEEEVGVVLHHGVGLAGQVTQPGQVEPGPGRNLQHAAPSLVAQQLHLRWVQQPFLRALVPVPESQRQRVVQVARPDAHGLPVDRQDPGVDDDLRQLRPAALTQRPPLGRQLAGVGERVRTQEDAERSEEESGGGHDPGQTRSNWNPFWDPDDYSFSWFHNVTPVSTWFPVWSKHPLALAK